MPESSVDAFPGLDILSTSVLLLDHALVLRFVNAAAENLLAINRKEAVGKLIGNVVEFPASFQEILVRVSEQGWGYTGQNIEVDSSAGFLHLNCTVSPAESEGGGLIVELWPIDQQLKATREERLLEQQVANRVLIRNLAHEIKNPLGGIRGAAQLLEREFEKPELKEYTQVIIKESDRLQDLMKRLLSPHRPMQPAPLNIHEVLERVRSLLVAEFPGKIDVRRDYDTSLPDLVGDREQLIQAVLNVARNAAQAILEQVSPFAVGQITLRTRIDRQVTLAKKHFALAVCLQVIDNGPGIPLSIKESMFFPLVSGRDGGNGVGLTLAQSFVLQHQGTIDCESRPGRTCFTIRLPLERTV